MRHGVKKVKFKTGTDGSHMLLRKLSLSFLEYGAIVTTEKRAKIVKQYMEKLVEKAKEKTESNKNYLLKSLASNRWVDMLFTQVGPVIKNHTGGYLKLEKLTPRESDGASMARIKWTYPVVKEEKKEEPKKEKKTAKPATPETKDSKKVE